MRTNTMMSSLLSTSMMTAAERAKGRFMRAPDGHGDGGKFTQADLDAAVKAANDKLQESIDKLEAKTEQLIGENRKLKRGAEIKPEDLQAAEDRADKAEAALTAANKQVSALTKERDTAVKSLEAEQGAARSYALDAEINAAIAAGNIVPALVPAFTAMVKQNAKADLVDGKYAVTIGDKSAKDHITAFLGSEEGKAFKGAPVNGGGGAGGSTTTSATQKTMLRSAFDALPPAEQHSFTVKEGGKVVDATA